MSMFARVGCGLLCVAVLSISSGMASENDKWDFKSLPKEIIGGIQVFSDRSGRTREVSKIFDEAYKECKGEMNLSKSLDKEINDDTFIKEIFPLLKGMKSLKCVILSDQPVTNKIGPYLAQLGQLRKLSLNGTGITDAIGLYLALLPQLKKLNLNGTGITDAIGPYLELLTQLRKLNLNGTGITDAIGPYLELLTQLMALNLGHTGVTDAIGPYLEPLTQLMVLNLGHTGVTNKIGPSFPKNLLWLDLSFTKVTNRIGPYLAQLGQLQKIRFRGTEVTNAIDKYLPSLLKGSRRKKIHDSLFIKEREQPLSPHLQPGSWPNNLWTKLDDMWSRGVDSVRRYLKANVVDNNDAYFPQNTTFMPRYWAQNCCAFNYTGLSGGNITTMSMLSGR